MAASLRSTKTAIIPHKPEHPEVSPTDPVPNRRLELVEKIIEMLYKKDPGWRKNPFPPNQAVVAELAERADFLLNAADGYLARRIHAYQLFAPDGPMMRIREIESRFGEFEWTEGKSHNTLRPKIRTLLGYAENEVSTRSEAFAGLLTERRKGSDSKSLPGPMSMGEFLEQLEGEVMLLLDRLGLRDVVTDGDALQDAVVASVVKLVEVQLWRSSPAYRDEDPTVSLAAGSFMQYVCAADTVKEYEARDERSVRPHELFLFASQCGYLEDELTMNVRKLKEGMERELEPSVRTSLSILETHGGTDAAIDVWMRKNDPQDVAPGDARMPGEERNQGGQSST